MQFNSYIFGVFFALVLAVYNAPFLAWRGQKIWLLVTSYLFYAAWDPVFIVLVWLSTIIDYTAAAWIWNAPSKSRKRLLMVLSVVVNIGILAYFKYGNFVLENLVHAAHALGIDYQPARHDIVLPIGISFYTFHTLSYTLDVYLGRTKPIDSWLDFALYVTFFPALVAGPILRASQFLPQCRTAMRTTSTKLAWGLALLVLGLFEKTTLADIVLAPTADALFATSGHANIGDAWLGTLAFAGQIFCDFAGYSTCAIGVALCLGFSLPDNFRFPYAARGFSDFWTRWHISLSSWLRDYLYIPLGGNRHGVSRTYINLMLTMLIGGLWHGASWTFVVWGGLHGLYLVGERGLAHVLPAGAWRQSFAARLAGVLVTFVLVCIAWVFFRATSFAQAFNILVGMFGGGPDERVFPLVDYKLVLPTVGLILLTHWFLRDRSVEQVVAATPWSVRAVVLGVMIFALVVMQGADRAFIYFQF